MLLIGSHVGFKKDSQVLGSLQEALSYGANTFMFYTGAPQNTNRCLINEELTKKAHQLMKEKNIDVKNLVIHAPYIINLANKTNMDFGVRFLKEEIKRAEKLGISSIVLHPGSHVGVGYEEGIKNIIECLNLSLLGNVKILIETMAGKGTECASTIDEVAYIINNTEKKDQIGVCVDTCHINDAGYDVSNFDNYLLEFDEKIGFNKIGCLHINDSKNPLGSHKDRHANIGKGTIGFDTLLKVIYHEKLENIPKILETPYIGDTDDAKDRLYPPYKYEISMIRNKEYKEDYFTDIRNEYSK